MAARIRLELAWLEALPLDPAARATLWRELLLLQQRSPDPGADAQACAIALERRLFAEELDRSSHVCLAGNWLEGSRRIEALQSWADSLGEGAVLGERLIELLTRLHRLLIDEAEAAAAAPADGIRPIDAESRAELLWQGYRWQLAIASLLVHPPERLAVIGEQIVRYGAIAWHARARQAATGEERLRALRRAQTLLLQLAPTFDPCPAWIAQSLRQGLQLALLADAAATPTPEELLHWARGYIDHALPAEAREEARQRLWPAEAALEVGEALRLPLFCHVNGP
jgi:hypothetical protein